MLGKGEDAPIMFSTLLQKKIDSFLIFRLREYPAITLRHVFSWYTTDTLRTKNYLDLPWIFLEHEYNFGG